MLGLELLPSITFLSLPLPQHLVSSCSSLKALCHLLQKALWEASSLPSLHISLSLDIPRLSFLFLCLLPSPGLELVDISTVSHSTKDSKYRASCLVWKPRHLLVHSSLHDIFCASLLGTTDYFVNERVMNGCKLACSVPMVEGNALLRGSVWGAA